MRCTTQHFQTRLQEVHLHSQTCIESYSAATLLSSWPSAGNLDVCNILLKRKATIMMVIHCKIHYLNPVFCIGFQ